MVEIQSDEDGSRLIGRREAILRAKAIIDNLQKGSLSEGLDIAEALLRAAADAKKKDPSDPRPYHGRNFDLWLKLGRQELRGQAVDVPAARR